MKTQLLAALLLTTISASAFAHDPAAHRKAAVVPAECTQFVGKDVGTINLKDPAVKAAHDKCELAKKAAKQAAEDQHEH